LVTALTTAFVGAALAGATLEQAAPQAPAAGPVIYNPVETWHDVGAPSRIAASPDGTELVLLTDGGSRIRRLATDGSPLGQIQSFGLSAIAAGAGGSVYAVRDLTIVRPGPAGYDMWSDRIQGPHHPQIGERLPFLAALGWDPLMSRVTLLFDRDTTQSFAYSSAGNRYDGPTLMFPTHVYWDIDYDAGRGYLLNRSTNSVEVYEGGGAVAVIPLPERAERIAVGPGGRLLALADRRRVYALDASDLSGTVLDVWDATSSEPDIVPSTVTDLTVDAAGRVYVTDPSRDRVRVYAPQPGTRTEPGPGPAGPGCQTVPSKWASPTFLWLGQQTKVTLRLDGSCQEVAEKADIVLLVDRSESMNYEGGSKIVAARESLLAFLGLMDLRRDQVALVTFASDARIDHGLTQDRSAVEAAIRALTAGGGTDIARGLDLAHQALAGPNRRPDAKPIVVLMTDGVPFDTTALRAVAARDRLRHSDLPMAPSVGQRHVITYAIGLGEDVNPDLLRVLASTPDLYYYAPDAADLEAVYRAIARRIAATVLLKQLTIVDVVPGNMTYQIGSAVPPAQWDPSARTLTWVFTDVPFAGVEVSYWLQPQQVGEWPTNVRADYTGTDGLDQPQAGVFPVPRVVVVAPTFTPSATVVPSPTATVTPSRTRAVETPAPSPTATPQPTVTVPSGTPETVTTQPTTPPPVEDTPSATPEPEPEPSATVTPHATPDRYTIYVIIVFNGACFQRYTDVALVIDASTTMLEPSEDGRIKLQEAKDAARVFLQRLQLEPDRQGRHDQAAIVWYNDVAAVEQPLTNDREALLAAIDRIRPVEGSRIDLGLEVGHRELLPAFRPNRKLANTPAMVLLSDGLPNRVPTPVADEPRPQEETVVRAADAAKADGITVFSVGYGRRVHTALMERVASQPAQYYFAPDGDALERIYNTIAGQLVCR